MSSAAVLEPEMRVVASIRALQAARRMSNEELWGRTGIKRSRFYERMRDGHFTIGEVMAIANVFGVSVQSLVDGQLTLPTTPPNFRLHEGEGKDPLPRTPLLGVAR